MKRVIAAGAVMIKRRRYKIREDNSEIHGIVEFFERVKAVHEVNTVYTFFIEMG